MQITFDYQNERRNIVINNDEVNLWEILQCIEEQTKVKKFKSWIGKKIPKRKK